jgi:beta propeller domain-containing protein
MGLPRWPRAATVVAAVVGLGAGVAGTMVVVRAANEDPVPPGGRSDVRLVAYDTCDTALSELKQAALPHVTEYGFGDSRGRDGDVVEDSAGAQEKSSAPADAPSSSDPEHSGTNIQESGVDEPDLVKTDGKRLVSIVDGVLRVVDVASHTEVGTLRIPGVYPTQLLLDGDRALVMTSSGEVIIDGPAEQPQQQLGSQLVLIDLTNASVLETLAVDGNLIDARQVDSVARVVLRSGPRFEFSRLGGVLPGSATTRNREIVANSSIEDWLPRYELTTAGRTETGQAVDCAAVSHTANYTGSSMLTVLTVDLQGKLGTENSMSMVADGDTVYGTDRSIYVADDHLAAMGGDGTAKPVPGPEPSNDSTQLYQFDISGAGKPEFVASGEVPGRLLNQYSLSEHEGNLRIATTEGDGSSSQSMITVVSRQGESLTQVGKVDGLGVGEQIYAVRFIGDVGYVVTFRQTDPLYTVDLSDPAAPRVVGELKITGYSAYLHPAGDGRLIGVGQEATTAGRTTGTQVSLFDVANLSTASVVAQQHLPETYSEVESDPHAFLYWEPKNLLVLPVSGTPGNSGSLVLSVDGGQLTQVGIVSHGEYSSRRAVVIGEELWTLSDGGIKASSLSDLSELAWLPFA